MFRDIQFPVVLLNVTGNINLGAVSVGMPFLPQAAGTSPQMALGLPGAVLTGLTSAGLSAEHARGAAFPGSN